MTSKYRTRQIANTVIGLSVSFERENLLARGMGLEHLHELLVRLARPILRQGASLAFAGHWKETEDNLMFVLLRLLSAEQEERDAKDPDAGQPLGMLFNHAAWPHYLKVTPQIEARWIGCCRIVRVNQKMAGLAAEDIVPDDQAESATPRVAYNKAVTLSAMRRLMMTELTVAVPDAPSERVPPVVVRILLGGKLERYTGFLPGIFEEALAALDQQRPTYILGGFGGAAEALARAILNPGARPPELTLAWQRAHNKGLAELLDGSTSFASPAQLRTPTDALDALYDWIEKARVNLSVLQTGLTHEETRELLQTRNIAAAVRLVRRGLSNTNKLQELPG